MCFRSPPFWAMRRRRFNFLWGVMTYDIHRAIEIFRSNEKYWFPTVTESAKAVVADYPQISVKADSLRRNHDFISAWKDVVKRKESTPQSELRNPNSQIHNPQSQIPNFQSSILNPNSTIPNPKSEISIESEVDYLRQIAKQKSKQRENEEKIKYLLKQLEESEISIPHWCN